jgi:hypothetical protein
LGHKSEELSESNKDRQEIRAPYESGEASKSGVSLEPWENLKLSKWCFSSQEELKESGSGQQHGLRMWNNREQRRKARDQKIFS